LGKVEKGQSYSVCHNRDAFILELIAMSHVSEQILHTVEVLSAEDQQQVLDFAEFLWAKRQRVRLIAPETAPRSFFEVAQVWIGAGEGPGDLSTNPNYMQGYGQ
jgi:hypothetical protein